MIASMVRRGHVITDDTDRAVVLTGPHRNRRYAPGQVNFLIRRSSDQRAFSVTVADTDHLEVVGEEQLP